MSAKAPQISLPQGGGAVRGLGESFNPDLQTGTGNLSLPLELPAGRNGFQPSLALAYSTGSANGPFGLGWALSMPGVRRKTSAGLPRYDGGDTFVLSGAEDLVPVPGGAAGRQRYRPRVEGLFARIEHVTGDGQDYWEVQSRDGLRSRYGTVRRPGAPADSDPAALSEPANPRRVFGWLLAETADPFGNVIRYHYEKDSDGHSYTQLYLSEISYADYGDPSDPGFVVRVALAFEPRPDPFSDRRAGFEIRTTKRCARIETWIRHQTTPVLARTVHLDYMQADGNGRSLLTRVQVEGHDGATSQMLPALEFAYTAFTPLKRRYQNVAAPAGALPATSLGRPDTELVDLFGNGLPGLLQMNGQVRYWRNLGQASLDRPHSMTPAPPVALADQGVQLADMTGDGRADLLVSQNPLTGYYPLTFTGTFDPAGFVPYKQAPAVNLEDPQVRLVDLNGDGIIDALRTGSSFELYYNHLDTGWDQVALAPPGVPAVDFRDPRVKLADMTGDGLPDIVLVHDRNLTYWPHLGYGRWDPPITIVNPPHFEDSAIYGTTGYDPRRLLVGDIDGDGCADLVYVGNGHVTVWINQSGQRLADPVVIPGTPRISDTDAVRLTDLNGTGTAGILWSYDAGTQRNGNYKFLDLTGATKPYLLDAIDNHRGARTSIEYAPSTRFYLADHQTGRPWRTTLPFPVQVVARTSSFDEFSNTTLASEYRYHHGYWDGTEREFRGFARVDHVDTLTSGSGQHYSPPTETRTWFHVGPIGPEHGDWREIDLSDEYWTGDPRALGSFSSDPPSGLPRRALRDAIRAKRGQMLRSELYALDGDTERQLRPYTVTEHAYGVREEAALETGEPADRQRIFFAHPLAERTTQWERGTDPLTICTFSSDYDAYGHARSQSSIAAARGREYRIPLPRAAPAAPYLATETVTSYAQRDDIDHYIVDRVARTTTFEIVNDGTAGLLDLHASIDAGTAQRRIVGQQRHFYDGAAFEGLPVGQLGDYGALGRTETLILTDDLIYDGYRSADTVLSPPEAPPYLAAGAAPAWTAEYPQGFRDQLPADAGYTFQPQGPSPEEPAGYFAPTERRAYDFHATAAGPIRGLLITVRDPLGHDTHLSHNDGFDLLPTDTTDPVGLTTHADYDNRVLQRAQITDPNGNRTAYTYTPLGLLESTAVMGPANGNVGDTLTAPSTRLEYDLLAFDERKQPSSVHTVRRVHHANDVDVALPERDQTIEHVEYSDGFGRLLQTRAHAEDVTFGDDTFGDAGLPVDQSQNHDAVGQQVGNKDQPHVVVSGWQVYDNKGRVVEKYEPFFSTGWAYGQPRDAQSGRKAMMFYDPRGQLVRTVYPDGAEQRVVHGVPGTIASIDVSNPDVFEPTPWETYTYDPNDNAGRTHPATSTAYQNHWNTPSSIVVDALGRIVRTVERNGPDRAADWHTTLSTYDIRGNLLTLTDALGRVAFLYVYDLAAKAQVLRVESIDAGVRRTLRDAAGPIVEQRDSKGSLVLHAHDALRRPSRMWARDDQAGHLTLREQLEYGDGGDPHQPPADRDANRQLNRLGRLSRHFDEAGRLTLEAYDFKGSIVGKTRQVISDTAILSVFNPPPPHWNVPAYRVDWTPPTSTTLPAHANSLLDPTRYETDLTYDALNRVTTLLYPQDAAGARKQLRPRYNAAGRLEQVELDANTYVERIAYNAKGQRVLIAYGNGIMTRYAHDPDTLRPVRLRSERYAKPDPNTYHPVGAPHQDFGYEHDLVGNVLWIHDRTPGSGTPLHPGQLERHFTYQPIYRLSSATGREAALPPAPAPWDDAPKPADMTRVRDYSETYGYDKAGNLLRLDHTAGAGSFTRSFTLDPDNRAPRTNRLAALTAATTSRYAYDAAGNLTDENSSRHYEWDHSCRLRAYRTQTAAAEPSQHAHYLYDATGERVKKLIRHNGGTYDVAVYLDGIFEYRREAQGAGAVANNRVHVTDDNQRIAMVRVGPPLPKDSTPAVRFDLPDHLGSSNVVLDAAGALINREEYAPYGETTFGSYAKKRYRFTGNERDEESALSHHGARYLAPWLSRWISCDPAGAQDSTSLYVLCKDNPVRFADPGGRQARSADSPSDAHVDFTDADVAAHPDAHFLRADARSPDVPAVSKTSESSTTQSTRVTGWFFFGGLAEHFGSKDRPTPVGGEFLGLGGYDRKKGVYAGSLTGLGLETKRSGSGRHLGFEGTRATERLHYFRSGRDERESLRLGEVGLGVGPSAAGVHAGIGGFINPKDPREVGVFVFGSWGSVAGGGGATLHLNLDPATELQATLGIPIRQLPEGTRLPPTRWTQPVDEGFFRLLGIDLRGAAEREIGGINQVLQERGSPLRVRGAWQQ